MIFRTSLRQLTSFCGVFAKLEMENPTGSAKDRAAACMLRQAQLAPGSTIIEPTSGNTGIALAALARQQGHKTIIVMPDSMSPERIRVMEEYGAQVVLTPGTLADSIAWAQALLQEIPGSWMPSQFENPANPLAHYETTGPEIWEQMAEQVDIFVCAAGTGGTISGTARFLKEQNPQLQVIAVEPAGSPVLSGGQPGPHGLQGIGPGFIPKTMDTSLLTGVIPVTEVDAFATARRLLAKEGICCGITGGAALWAAEKTASRNPGKRVVTILPDTGERYRSCGLFEE